MLFLSHKKTRITWDVVKEKKKTRKTVPFGLTTTPSFALYVTVDPQGAIQRLEEEEYPDVLKEYYFMEYNELIRGEDYRAELFLIHG